MADENVGLDLASQTGQEDIVEAITNLSSNNGLANQTGQQNIAEAIEGIIQGFSNILSQTVIKTTNLVIGSLNVTKNGIYDAENDDTVDVYNRIVVNIPQNSIESNVATNNGYFVSNTYYNKTNISVSCVEVSQ